MSQDETTALQPERQRETLCQEQNKKMVDESRTDAGDREKWEMLGSVRTEPMWLMDGSHMGRWHRFISRKTLALVPSMGEEA